MKQFYFTLIFSLFSLLSKAQTYPTGSATEVGTTEGQLTVSLSGAANYSIPIAVPPGINGVVPQVSLVYNSQAGNGMAGYGWNIAGVSMITRIPSTKYHDGAIDPVDFDELDRFAFNGQRLLVKSGTTGVYGANGTVYETESFSNVKITSYGVHPSGAKYGPEYFLVEYPDGSIAYYGKNQNQRSQMEWGITVWRNPQGVQVVYEYIEANTTLFIKTIYYGSIIEEAGPNTVNFVYQNRTRPEQNYVGGQSFISKIILEKIEVKAKGIGFRNYVLAHDKTSLDYERLISITEKNGDNTKSYNPTVFEYDLTTNSTNPLKAKDPATIDFTGLNSSNTAYISGDFDTDGKIDLILYTPEGIGAKDKYSLYTDIKAGSFNTSTPHAVGRFETIFPATFLSSNNKIMPQGWVVSKKTDTTYTFTAYGKGSTSAIAEQYSRIVNFPIDVYEETCTPTCNVTKSHRMFPKKIFSGDFNGDGLTDVIAIDIGGITSTTCGDDGAGIRCVTQSEEYISNKVYFVDLKRNNVNNFLQLTGELASKLGGAKVEIIDFDGDGKSDIMLLDTGFVKVYTLDSSNKLVLLYQNTASDPGIVLNKPILFGDYNGDGKSDFVIPNAVDQDSWNFYLATGTTFHKINGAIGVTYEAYKHGSYGFIGWSIYTYSHNDMSFIANDYNGDGKTDILFQQNFTIDYIWENNVANYDRNGESQTTKLVLLENKSITDSAVHFSMVNTSSQIAGIRRYPIAVFTNHDKVNQNLEYSLISNDKIVTFNSPKDNRIDVLVNAVTTGNGVKETVTYSPLRQDEYEPFYTPTVFTETFPDIDITIAPSFKIVTKLEKQSAAVYKKQLFFYSGAVSNTEGIGFMGFRSTVRTNWHDDTTPIISSIAKNDMSLRGTNVENYTVLGLYTPLLPNLNATKMVSTIVKENHTVTGTENLVATQSITLKPNTWIKAGSSFSAKINEDANTGTSPNTPTDFITKSVMAYESELLPNKVFKLKNILTKEYNSLENTSSETRTAYDGYNNPLTATTLLKEAGVTVQTTVSTIGYNAASPSPYVVGRPASKTQSVTLTGDVMRTEELYFYNNSLLTQIKKKGTDTDYITEDNVYDAFGNITEKKITVAGLAPRITKYVYDTSGRFLIKSTDIEGLSTTFDYNLSNGLLNSETNPYGLTTSYLYDSWFKKIKTTDYLGKTNNYVYTRTAEKTKITTTGDDGSASEDTFDDLGRKIKSGVRNIMGSFAYVDYLYDILDRNYKTSEPYFGTSPTQWNETKYDDYGRIIQNIAFTGKTTNITYSGLSTTVNDGTKSKTTTKNAMGNVATMTDTPGGTIKYTYFANGNLKESDYAGVKTTILQDGWGRKTKLVDSSAGTYTYAYNNFGETTKETTPNGTTTYTLDAVGKLTQKTIVGTNTNSKTTYAYDPTSKLLLSSKLEDLTNGTHTTLHAYTYDASRRMTKTVETTPYATFTKELAYDSFGRVYTETSTAAMGGKSSTKTIRNTYKNGAHWQILDHLTSAVLWQTNTINARGQLTGAQNGPTTLSNTYDSYGLVTQSKYDKTATSTNILTLNTLFDAKRGNLTSRSNTLWGWNESFVYDAQDRLTQFANAQGIPETQTYDDRGRITQNSLGTYAYDTAKTYQNKAISLTPEATGYYGAREGIFNDSMESRTGWSLNAYNSQAITFDATKAHTGKNALKINTAAIGATISYVQSDVAVAIDNTVATQYNFSGWVYTDNPTAQLTLFMYKAGETGYYTNVNSASTTTKNTWVYIDQTFLVPANIKSLRLRLDNVGTGTVWFDDVQIRKTSDAATAVRALNITYNTFKSPVQIEETGVDKISFTYNDANQRSSMFYGGLQDDKLLRPLRKHYSTDGSMEIKHNTATGAIEFVTYIGGDGYSAPIVYKITTSPTTNNQEQLLYLQRDYQGSIVAIADQAGTIVEKRLFGAWGAIIKVQDGAGNTLAGLTVLDRGYTGHEHLQSVGLIHMNGRLYTAKLHRFLQPDNFVQDPYNTQNYNRYGYVLNNPLKYTDVSGEWIWIVVAAVVGGVVNWATHGAQFNMEGLKAFGIGAAAGTIGALTGGAGFAAAGGAAGGIGGFAAGAFGGAIGAGFSSIFLSAGNNIAFGDPLMTPKQFIIGITVGAVLGGTVNGFTAVRNGNTFWKGVDVTPKVQPISVNPSGLAKTGGNAEIKTSDYKVSSSTQPSTTQTTQANTATVINKETGYVDLSKNADFQKIVDQVETNSVYQGVEKTTGEIKYIGITERAPDVRFSEHLNSGTTKSLLRYEVIDGAENLSRINARIFEQSLINQFGKDNLLNIRNSIAPKYWSQYGIKP